MQGRSRNAVSGFASRAGRMTIAALASLAAVGVPRAAQAQQDFSTVEIEITHVSGNVYMLVGRGGNIGVSSGADGTLIVDDQFAPLADKIRAALRQIGKSDEQAELKFILNTHWHGDHTGGNPEFGREAPIIAHRNVRKRLSTPQEIRGNAVEPLPEVGLPVVTFADSLSIHFNGEEIRALHLPHGHTDGDAVIFFGGSNVVHMGDDFFAGRFPFVDLESGGSVQGLVEDVRTVLDEIPADAHVIPGHGPLSTVEDLRAYHRMLVETIDFVRDRMAAGKSLEDIQAEGLPSEWDSWGRGFINAKTWLATIFQSLSSR
ncbi:MAG: MBL fold metallo-hydrolase [Gemmatimonadota bacterium]